MHEALLRETIEHLAGIERPACSAGEREAAEWLAARLSVLGCEARVEEEAAYADFALPIAELCGLGVAGGLAVLRGRRASGGLLAVVAGTLIADDVSNGPRLFRRLTMRRRPTWNVVATTGDRSAERTLVVLAHHDAAPTGLVFDQSAQRRLWERFPGVIERMNTSIPLWWLVFGPPLAVGVGAVLGRRRLVGLATGLGALSVATMLDIARSPVVPGANDNLTGVAGLVGLARAFEERPVDGLRVVLASCGAEETLQGGIHGFAARHFPSLPINRTWFVNLDTVGSPHLVLLEGEGPVVMEDYEAGFKDLIAEVAAAAGVALRRGLRSRNSTDSVIPSRAGYPVGTIVSITDWKALANYHWPSDVPENVEYETVEQAVRLTEAVARRLAVDAAA